MSASKTDKRVTPGEVVDGTAALNITGGVYRQCGSTAPHEHHSAHVLPRLAPENSYSVGAWGALAAVLQSNNTPASNRQLRAQELWPDFTYIYYVDNYHE